MSTIIARQDRNKMDIYVTSAHRASPCYEWSKGISRENPPFFVAMPMQTSGASIQGQPEKVPRHMQSPLPMDRVQGRNQQEVIHPDIRNYEAKSYEDWHRHCAVNIQKGKGRSGGMFGVGSATSNVDSVYYPPPWGKGKKSWFPKAGLHSPSRGGSPSAMDLSSPQQRAGCQTTDLSDTLGFSSTQITAGGKAAGGSNAMSRKKRSLQSPFEDSAMFAESRIHRPLGGPFGKAKDRELSAYPDMSELKVNIGSVARHTSNVSLSRYAGRKEGREKLSTKYLPMFRTPPPAPMSVPQKKRICSGFAPQRFSFRSDVESILAVAEADRKRAHTVMDQNFRLDRSAQRDFFLYTPSPVPTGGEEGSERVQSPSSLNPQ